MPIGMRSKSISSRLSWRPNAGSGARATTGTSPASFAGSSSNRQVWAPWAWRAASTQTTSWAASQHVDETDQHAGGVGADRRIRFLLVLAHHAALEGVPSADEDTSDAPFKGLYFKMAETGGVAGGDPVTQRLGGRFWGDIGGKGTREGGAAVGPSCCNTASVSRRPTSASIWGRNAQKPASMSSRATRAPPK